MAIVINEFEVVPEPAPAPAPSSGAPAAAAAGPTARDIERVIERRRERLLRVWAH